MSRNNLLQVVVYPWLLHGNMYEKRCAGEEKGKIAILRTYTQPFTGSDCQISFCWHIGECCREIFKLIPSPWISDEPQPPTLSRLPGTPHRLYIYLFALFGTRRPLFCRTSPSPQHHKKNSRNWFEFYFPLRMFLGPSRPNQKREAMYRNGVNKLFAGFFDWKFACGCNSF